MKEVGRAEEHLATGEVGEAVVHVWLVQSQAWTEIVGGTNARSTIAASKLIPESACKA